MYAILIATECIVELHQITAGTVTLACDNLSAINTAEEGYIPNVRQANFDFVQSIVKLIQASPLTWLPQHVKGHQDDGPRIRPLTLLECLNIHMDTLAKGYWSHIIRNFARIPPPLLPIPSGAKDGRSGEGIKNTHSPQPIISTVLFKISRPNTGGFDTTDSRNQAYPLLIGKHVNKPYDHYQPHAASGPPSMPATIAVSALHYLPGTYMTTPPARDVHTPSKTPHMFYSAKDLMLTPSLRVPSQPSQKN